MKITDLSIGNQVPIKYVMEDTICIDFEHKDKQGNNIDLNGSQVDVFFKNKYSDPDIFPLLHFSTSDGSITLQGPNQQIARIVAPFNAKSRVYKVRVSHASGFVFVSYWGPTQPINMGNNSSESIGTPSTFFPMLISLPLNCTYNPDSGLFVLGTLDGSTITDVNNTSNPVQIQ